MFPFSLTHYTRGSGNMYEEESQLLLREAAPDVVPRKSLLLDDSSYTKEQLIVSLRRRPVVHKFLKAFAIIWPCEDTPLLERVVRILYNTVTRLVLVACAVLVSFNLVSFLATKNVGSSADLAGWGLDVVFIIQSIALLVSLVLMQRRLSSISTFLEISFFEASVPYCIGFFALSFFPALLYPIYHILVFFPDPSEESLISAVEMATYLLLPFAELTIAGFLSANLLFILVDAQTLSANFAELKRERLYSDAVAGSAERFDLVLEEINFRVGSALQGALPIILAAVLEIAVLGGLVYSDFVHRRYIPVLLLLFLFLKEILYLLTVLAMLSYCGVKRLLLNGKRSE